MSGDAQRTGWWNGWWAVRCRRLLDEWFLVVLLVLLLVAAAGGWWAYSVHATEETTTEEVVVATWSERQAFEHSALVERPNEVFPVDTRLQGRSTYFSAISPNLDGSYTYQYGASDDGSLDVQIDLVLLLQSAGDEETVYWSVDEPLGSHEASGVSPNSPQTVDFSLNASAIGERLERIESSLGASPGQTRSVIRARVSTSGTVNGESVSRTLTHSLPIVPEGSTYRVENPGLASNEYETTETRTVLVEPSPLEEYGSIGIVAIAALTMLGLVVARWRGLIAPSAELVAGLERQREREEFDDWISRGQLPMGLRSHQKVAVDSLEDLVDIAIDCNRRVIEEIEDDRYYVIDRELLYEYTPTSERSTVGLTQFAETDADSMDGEGTLSVSQDGEESDLTETKPEQPDAS